MERAMEREIRRVFWGPDTIISPLGLGTKANYLGIEGNRTPLSRCPDGTPACLIDFSMVEESVNRLGIKEHSRAEQLSIIALSNLCSRSGVDPSDKQTLIILSTTKGNVEYINSDFDRSYLWSSAELIGSYFHTANTPVVISNACISGVSALVIASRLIAGGSYDNIFVVGVDVLSDFIVSGFNAFKSVSPTLCKPYDISRDGLTLGEGCGAVLLTSDAELSGSGIVVAGGGISNDANHISGPSRTGDGLFFAIRAAMDEAGVESEEIGLVNTHGTGTPYNDEMESKALALASLDGIPCNSLKPYLGHTLGASGVIETILTAAQMSNSRIFGVKGYYECGVPYPLSVSAVHRDMEVEVCLKTASGFGGTNAAIVLSKHTVTSATSHDIPSTLRASFKLSGPQNKPFGEFIREEYKALNDPNMKFAKMDDLSKLGYVASCKLLSGMDMSYPAERIAIVLSNRSASLDSDLRHQAIVDQKLPEGASPAVFVYTLANIVAGEIAIKHKFQGEQTFFIQKNKDLTSVEHYAQGLIGSGKMDAVIYGWCELLGEDYEAEIRLITK